MEQDDVGSARTGLITRLFAIPGSGKAEERKDGTWISAPQLDVEAMAREMIALGFRLVTMTGLAGSQGETTIIYHYAQRRQYVHFTTTTRRGAIPSLTPMLRMASWMEREIHDLFAANFIGHPNLIPLVRPPGLKEGFFREAESGSIVQVEK